MKAEPLDLSRKRNIVLLKMASVQVWANTNKVAHSRIVVVFALRHRWLPGTCGEQVIFGCTIGAKL